MTHLYENLDKELDKKLDKNHQKEFVSPCMRLNFGTICAK